MSKKQIEEDLHDCAEEYIDVEEERQPVKSAEATPTCPHLKYKFCFPAGRHHDVYSCVECGHVIYKSWDETATTTYKDRV